METDATLLGDLEQELKLKGDLSLVRWTSKPLTHLVEALTFTLDLHGNLLIASETKSIHIPAGEVRHMLRWLHQHPG